MSTSNLSGVQNSFIKREPSAISGSVSPSKASAIRLPAEVLSPASASTLQHAVLNVKFPKGERFPPIKLINDSQPPLYLPSTLSPRTTSLGYGHKVLMSELVMKNGWDVPPPNQYSPKTWSHGGSGGKSFGASYEVYRKVYNPHAAEMVLPEVSKEQPGPGTYELSDGFGGKGKHTTLKPRGKMFNELNKSEAPASNHYFPSLSLIESSRHKSRHFGYGDRSDFTKDGGLSPGPGAYKIPSKFDQYTQKKAIQERLQEKLKLMKIK